MVDIFPLELKLGHIKEIVVIIKENGGVAPMSLIAKDSKLGIDRLFPVINAGKMLNLLETEDGVVMLKPVAKKMHSKEFKTVLKRRMSVLEPFKSIISYLKKTHGSSTMDLFDSLLQKGLVTQVNRSLDIADFRKELVGLLIRTGICVYDPKKDFWKLSKD